MARSCTLRAECHCDSQEICNYPDHIKLSPEQHTRNELQSDRRRMHNLNPWLQSSPQQHNVQFSRLFQLPNELLLIIVDNLEGAGLLALRAVSTDFHKLISSFRDNATRKDSREFRRLRELDIYKQACEFEATGCLLASHLLCSYCKASHLRAAFAPSEQRKTPQVRRCLGATARIQICPHKSYTHEQVRECRYGQPHWATDSSYVRCSVCPPTVMSDFCSRFNPFCWGDECINPFEDSALVFLASWRHIDILIDNVETVTKKTLLSAFSKSNKPICQHMHISDVIDKIASISQKPSNKVKFWDCKKKAHGCLTYLCLEKYLELSVDRFRRPHERREYQVRLRLTTDQNLGSLRNVGCHNWLMQLENGEELCEIYKQSGTRSRLR